MFNRKERLNEQKSEYTQYSKKFNKEIKVRGYFGKEIGLIEKANNGIILLDEIHRLPPEGQEMLFLVIDKGLYRRMGETEEYRNVNTIIIGATTEDVNSSLLQTSLRRVPMVIRLPSLSQCPLDERYTLIKSFFNKNLEILNLQ